MNREFSMKIPKKDIFGTVQNILTQEGIAPNEARAKDSP